MNEGLDQYQPVNGIRFEIIGRNNKQVSFRGVRVKQWKLFFFAI